MFKSFKLLFLTSFLFTGYSFAEQITVDATKFPNAEILEVAKPILAKQGYVLKINVYNSYNDPAIAAPLTFHRFEAKNPNSALSDEKCDANFFQHEPYLDQYNKTFKEDLVSVGSIFYVPFAIYLSKPKYDLYNKTHDLAQVMKGSKIAISDAPINEARALKLLATKNIITLKSHDLLLGLDDVESNPYQTVIYKVDGSVISKMLVNGKVDVIVMNSGNASLSGLKLNRASFVEGDSKTYANILVARKDNANSAKIKALKNALQSPEVSQYIKKKYGSLVVPTF